MWIGHLLQQANIGELLHFVFDVNFDNLYVYMYTCHHSDHQGNLNSCLLNCFFLDSFYPLGGHKQTAVLCQSFICFFIKRLHVTYVVQCL